VLATAPQAKLLHSHSLGDVHGEVLATAPRAKLAHPHETGGAQGKATLLHPDAAGSHIGTSDKVQPVPTAKLHHPSAAASHHGGTSSEAKLPHAQEHAGVHHEPAARLPHPQAHGVAHQDPMAVLASASGVGDHAHASHEAGQLRAAEHAKLQVPDHTKDVKAEEAMAAKFLKRGEEIAKEVPEAENAMADKLMAEGDMIAKAQAQHEDSHDGPLYPEEFQARSLRALQEQLGPRRRLHPELREAGAAVEKAGRLLQYWVRRRQVLAQELPEFGGQLERCVHRAAHREGAAEARAAAFEDAAIRHLKESTKAEGHGAEEGQQASDGGGKALEATQEKFPLSQEGQGTAAALLPEGTVHESTQGKVGQAGGTLHESTQGNAAHPGGLGSGQQLAQDGKAVADALPGPDGGTAHENTQGNAAHPGGLGSAQQPPEDGKAAAGALQGPEAEDTIAAEDADDEAEGAEVDCDELQVPPQLLVARRAASEAYWAFDRALQAAGEKVGTTLDHFMAKGM